MVISKIRSIVIEHPVYGLEYVRAGVPRSTINNFYKVLKNDPRINGKLRLPDGFVIREWNLRYLIFEGFDEVGLGGHGRAILYYLLERYGFKSTRGLNCALLILLNEWKSK